MYTGSEAKTNGISSCIDREQLNRDVALQWTILNQRRTQRREVHGSNLTQATASSAFYPTVCVCVCVCVIANKLTSTDGNRTELGTLWPAFFSVPRRSTHIP